MGRALAFLVSGSIVLLCLYAATMPLSCAAFWAGVAAFTGTLVGTAGALLSKYALRTTVLCAVDGSLGIALTAYHAYSYGHFAQIHDVIWFGILGILVRRGVCWSTDPL